MTKKKVRVLFLIHTLQMGGAEKALVNLVNNLDASRFDITVMTVIDTGAHRDSLNCNIKYQTIYRIPFLSKKKKRQGSAASGNLLHKTSRLGSVAAKLYQWYWRHVNARMVYRHYIKEKYDVEVAFLEGVATKIIASSNNKESRKLAWVHVDLLAERKTDAFFRSLKEEKETYQQFDEIICVSNYVREVVIRKFGLDASKVLTRYNVMDIDEIIKKSQESVSPKQRFTMVTVGRLAQQKGYDRLLKVVDRLNKDDLKFDLWIIGVGAEEEPLKTYARSHRLSNVRFLGHQDNPYKYMREADLFICPSRAEGFSTVVSEAVILGCPVVTTDCSGMREILGDSEYGLICENSGNGIYGALEEILLDEKLYKHYAAKVKERKEFFDADGACSRIVELLSGEVQCSELL